MSSWPQMLPNRRLSLLDSLTHSSLCSVDKLLGPGVEFSELFPLFGENILAACEGVNFCLLVARVDSFQSGRYRWNVATAALFSRLPLFLFCDSGSLSVEKTEGLTENVYAVKGFPFHVRKSC